LIRPANILPEVDGLGLGHGPTAVGIQERGYGGEDRIAEITDDENVREGDRRWSPDLLGN
jgi:hypothetical protein